MVFMPTFAQPAVLFLLTLVPLLLWLWRRRGPATLRFSSIGLLTGLPKGRSVRARWGGLLLRGLGLSFLVVALAGPRWPDAGTRLPTEGIAIAMVVDVSASMSEADFAWQNQMLTRLDGVKNVFRLFVEGGDAPGGEKLPPRANDLISLVVFATRPETACPLTLDHAALLKILDEEQPRILATEATTNPGDALAWALGALRKAPTRRKVLVFLTDGESNVPPPALTPRQAAQLAGNLGIPIYAIGAGPEFDPASKELKDTKTSAPRANRWRKSPTSAGAAIFPPPTARRWPRRAAKLTNWSARRSPAFNIAGTTRVSWCSPCSAGRRGWRCWAWKARAGDDCSKMLLRINWKATPLMLPDVTTWFAYPILLALLAALPVLAILMLDADRRRRRTCALLGDSSALQKLQSTSALPGWCRSLCLFTGLALVIVASAGPRWGKMPALAAGEARPVVILWDVSRSMLAEYPSRQDLARRALRDLAHTLSKAGGPRLALVIFAAHAQLAMPLTGDYDHFLDLIGHIDADDLPAALRPRGAADTASGTRIGEAIRLAIHALEAQQGGDILLLSDGDDPGGDEEWLEGAEEARRHHLPVHAIGLGNPSTAATIPFGGGVLEYQGRPVLTRLQEKPLQEIARRSHGTYVPAHTDYLPLGRLLPSILADRAPEAAESESSIPIWQPRVSLVPQPCCIVARHTALGPAAVTSGGSTGSRRHIQQGGVGAARCDSGERGAIARCRWTVAPGDRSVRGVENQGGAGPVRTGRRLCPRSGAGGV